MRHQRPGDRVVVNADDASAGFADGNARRRLGALARPQSRARRLPRPGTRRRRHRRDDRDGARAHRRAQRPTPPTSSRRQRSRPRQAQIRRRSRRASTAPSHRPGARSRPARSAAFPSSTTAWPRRRRRRAATLARYPASSIVLIAGGLNDAGGGSVHATPAEIALLEQACDVIARVARVVVLFGEAGPRLAPLLARRQVELIDDERPRGSGRGGRAATQRARRRWCSRRSSRSRSTTESASATLVRRSGS